MSYSRARIARASAGFTLPNDDVLRLAECDDLASLMDAAEQLARCGFGRRVTYSRKAFIPLTHLCRDVCHYCTFAHPPRRGERAFMSIDEVLAVAKTGAAAGCKEALFTLGDKPELRYRVARQELQQLGFNTTVEYLAAAARATYEQTGLLPHLNCGVLSVEELRMLRPTGVSMGLMLESVSTRLCEKPNAHWGSPDKHPDRRLETLRWAGELAIPMTTGVLVGIGDNRRERIETLLAIRDLHARFGHIQEVIVQNFRAKPGTRMANHAEPDHADFLWTIAMARLVLGAGMSIQAPPNLARGELATLIRAGINDWGGVSPVTPDHVNPEAPWPELRDLEQQTNRADRVLSQRLALVPSFACDVERWVDPSLQTAVRRRIDATGHARRDGWHAGQDIAPPEQELRLIGHRSLAGSHFHGLIERAQRGETLEEGEIASLFAADGTDFSAIVQAADELRAHVNGETVSYVVNRNINYTNICSYACSFCAFAKGRSSRSLRGPAYDLPLDEIAHRATEAWQRGATEVCLQGGIHPSYTGRHYLQVVEAIKRAVPSLHVHAFSPLEVLHGATTLDCSIEEFLVRLRSAGLSTLPGTAAEILDDEVRAILCPDKLDTAQWLDVMRTAHRVGLKTTATIMFGHLDRPEHWALHLLRVRALQEETGGFTEFVPLPFVHMEAPVWRAGRARSGPTFREAVLMHAVARLVLYPVVNNIQTSWVKMGAVGAAACLAAGANDLGGTLMNESITRAAGGVNGQEFDAASLSRLIITAGRRPRQRTTLYGAPDVRHETESMGVV